MRFQRQDIEDVNETQCVYAKTIAEVIYAKTIDPARQRRLDWTATLR